MRILNFNKFKLLEKENLEELDDFSLEDDNEDGNENSDEDEDEDIEEEESTETNYDQNPSYYANQAIDIVTNRLVKLFQKESEEQLIKDRDESNYANNGVELIEVDKTETPLRKSVVIKYKDESFTYHLFITANIMKVNPDDEDTKNIKLVGIKFKKYAETDSGESLLGDLERKSEDISVIDRDYLDKLNAELDDKYSIDDDFDMEFEGDDNKSEKGKEDID